MVIQTDSERVRLSRRLVLEFLASSVDVSTAPERRRPTGALRRAHRSGSARRPPPSRSRRRSTTISTCATTPSAFSATSAWRLAAWMRRTPSRSPSPDEASRAHISTEYDVPLPDSACVYCGNCIGVCPTGALMFKSEYDMRAGGRVGRVAPDPHRYDLPLLRRGLHPDRSRAGRRDRQVTFAARPSGHPRQSLHQGPLRLAIRRHSSRLKSTSSGVARL